MAAAVGRMVVLMPCALCCLLAAALPLSLATDECDGPAGHAGDWPTQCWKRATGGCVVSVMRWSTDALNGHVLSSLEPEMFTSEDCGTDWWSPPLPVDYALRTDDERQNITDATVVVDSEDVLSATGGRMEHTMHTAISRVASACAMALTLYKVHCNKAVGAPSDPSIYAPQPPLNATIPPYDYTYEGGYVVEVVCCRATTLGNYSSSSERAEAAAAAGKGGDEQDTPPQSAHMTHIYYNASIGDVDCAVDNETGITLIWLAHVRSSVTPRGGQPTPSPAPAGQKTDCFATHVDGLLLDNARVVLTRSSHPSLLCPRILARYEQQLPVPASTTRFAVGERAVRQGHNGTAVFAGCHAVDELPLALGAAAHNPSMPHVVRGVVCPDGTDTCFQHVRLNYDRHLGIVSTMGGCGRAGQSKQYAIFSAKGERSASTQTFQGPLGADDPHTGVNAFGEAGIASDWPAGLLAPSTAAAPAHSAAHGAEQVPSAHVQRMNKSANAAVRHSEHMVPAAGGERTTIVPTGCQGSKCNVLGVVLCGFKRTPYSAVPVLCPQSACVRWLPDSSSEVHVGCVRDFFALELASSSGRGGRRNVAKMTGYFTRCAVLDDTRWPTAVALRTWGNDSAPPHVTVVRLQCCSAHMCLGQMERTGPPLAHITLCASKWLMFAQAPIHRGGTMQPDERAVPPMLYGNVSYEPPFDPLKYIVNTDPHADGQCIQALLRVAVTKRLPFVSGGASGRTVAHGGSVTAQRYVLLHTAGSRAAHMMHIGPVMADGAMSNYCFGRSDEALAQPWTFHVVSPSLGNGWNLTAWESIVFEPAWRQVLACMFTWEGGGGGGAGGGQSNQWHGAQRQRRAVDAGGQRAIFAILLVGATVSALACLFALLLMPIGVVHESNVDTNDWLQVDDEYERWKRLRGKYVRNLRRRQGLRVSWSGSATTSELSVSTVATWSSDEADGALQGSAFGPFRPIMRPITTRTIYRMAVRCFRSVQSQLVGEPPSSEKKRKRFVPVGGGAGRGGAPASLPRVVGRGVLISSMRLYAWLYHSMDKLPYIAFLGVAPKPPQLSKHKHKAA